MSVFMLIFKGIIRQITSQPRSLRDHSKKYISSFWVSKSPFDKIHLTPMSFKETLERILLIPWVILQSASSVHFKAIIQQSTAHLSHVILRGSLENCISVTMLILRAIIKISFYIVILSIDHFARNTKNS